jgi:hypothetical protein
MCERAVFIFSWDFLHTWIIVWNITRAREKILSW